MRKVLVNMLLSTPCLQYASGLRELDKQHVCDASLHALQLGESWGRSSCRSVVLSAVHDRLAYLMTISFYAGALDGRLRICYH